MFILDLETIPAYKSFADAPEEVQRLYMKRFANTHKPGDKVYTTEDEHYQANAAFHAEFGKIVCACIGYLTPDTLRVVTLCGRFEKILLEKLAEIIKINPEKPRRMTAHNGKEFDFPFLTRRYFINKLPLPPILDVYKVKTWETLLDDTMELWSSTQWKNKISLDLLCHCLGVESPKSDMTGADVAKVYYGMFEGNPTDALPFDKETAALERIGTYCQGDVIALARCICVLTGKPQFKEIQYVEPK